MKNIQFGYPNRTDEGTLSGGAWMASLPLTNLQDRVIAHVTRSSDLLLGSSKFDLNLGQPRWIGALALMGHNLSVTAKVRITGADSQANLTAAPAYTSGWVNVWPTGAIPQDMLEWEDDNFWLGTLTAEQRAAYNTPFTHTFTRTSLQWWRVEIDDTGNPAGYVQLGRLFVSDLWAPTYNYSYGADLGLEDRTGAEESLGGVEYFDDQAKYRVVRLSLDWLSMDETYARVIEMQRMLGSKGELLVIPDADDATHGFRRTLVGRLLRINPARHSRHDTYQATVEIKELL